MTNNKPHDYRFETYQKNLEAEKNKTAPPPPPEVTVEADPLKDLASQRLHEAIVVAEMFEEGCQRNRKGERIGYLIKEGWDLHDIIDALITFYGVYKATRVSYPAPVAEVPEEGLEVVEEVPKKPEIPNWAGDWRG